MRHCKYKFRMATVCVVPKEDVLQCMDKPMRPRLQLPDLSIAMNPAVERHLPVESPTGAMFRAGSCGASLVCASQQPTIRGRTASRPPQTRARVDDDFMGQRTSSSSMRGAGRGSSNSKRRLTQRQLIDDTTSVPSEVFEGMARLGEEARKRAQHLRGFCSQRGRPTLRNSGIEETPKLTPSPSMYRGRPCSAEVASAPSTFFFTATTVS